MANEIKISETPLETLLARSRDIRSLLSRPRRIPPSKATLRAEQDEIEQELRSREVLLRHGAQHFNHIPGESGSRNGIHRGLTSIQDEIREILSSH